MHEYDARRAHHIDRARLLAPGLPAETLFSHETAAIAGRLATYGIPAQLRLTGTRVKAIRTADVHVHKAGLRDCDVALVDGLPVTSLARTVVDLGRSLDFAAALVTADAALRAGVDREALNDVLRHQWTWPRIRHAIPVVRHADCRSESPIETVVRARFIQLQLPMPSLQHNIFNGGDWIARSDFYWEEFGLVGEADGRVKYGVLDSAARDAGDALWQEKLRQEDIEESGREVIRWTWAQAHAPDDVFATRFWRKVQRAQLLTRLRA